MASRLIGGLYLWKKPRLTGLVAASVVCPLALGVFHAGAQTVATSSGPGQNGGNLEFEVASVKPTAVVGAQFAQGLRSGQLKLGARVYTDRAEYSYMSLRQLIAEAYRVRPFQVVCPNWLLTERFDVVAKMPAGARKEDAPLMLRSLLAERFKLAVHRESREEDIMALVVGKGGPNLKESPSETPADPSHAAGQPPESPGSTTTKKKDSSPSGSFMMGTEAIRFTIDQPSSSIHIEASRMTMTDLAHLLMQADLGNGRSVVDMTGLEGSYEIVFDLPMSLIGGMTAATEESVSDPNAQGPRPAEAASDPGSGRMMGSLKSLGLELRKMKAPIEHVVVDRVERAPTAN